MVGQEAFPQVDAFLGAINRSLVWEPCFQKKTPDSLSSVLNPAWPFPCVICGS